MTYRIDSDITLRYGHFKPVYGHFKPKIGLNMSSKQLERISKTTRNNNTNNQYKSSKTSWYVYICRLVLTRILTLFQN